ncbi:hypothetical protein [Aeromonas sanarellii]|uniref:hypothetical protein n=1 Tax=Aeromonas sanarellii TaxID=633415 RepID=UPI003B9F5F89
MQSLELPAYARPVNNRPSVAASRPRGLQADVFEAASLRAIKEGMPFWDIQNLLERHDMAARKIKRHGPRPKEEGKLPGIPDRRFPFDGDTLQGVLTKAGLPLMQAQDAASKLAFLSDVLPAVRQKLSLASPSTRAQLHQSVLAVLAEITATVKGWEKDVQKSCFSDAAVSDWDRTAASIKAEQAQAESALTVMPTDRIDGYLQAVQTAVNRSELDRLTALLAATVEPAEPTTEPTAKAKAKA